MIDVVARDASTKTKLVRATLHLAAVAPSGGLSSRALAEEAHVSASAVNYAFGSLQNLLDEAKRYADDQISIFWADRINDLSLADLGAHDLAPLVFSINRQLVTEHPGAHALFWMDMINAARSGHGPVFSKSVQAEHRYWTKALAQSGLAHLHPSNLQAFGLALRCSYRLFELAEGFDPWAQALVNQLCRRLIGEHPIIEIDSLFRQRSEQAAQLSNGGAPPQHETASLIVQTTVNTILDAGVEAATFREIARRAGLSVSSVQHFFGSRKTYLAAAYQAIYAVARDRAIADVPAPHSLSIDDLSHFFARENPTSPILPHREFAAMQELMLTASFDRETRALAHGFLARTGQTSMQLLQSLKHARGVIGRLDAQILSLTLSHLVTLEVIGEVSTASSENLESLVRNFLTALFE